ncbi:peptidoglycan-binding protein [Actinoplanes sp. NPDC049265]|uniref:peptidoglycan-binding protein n=1 Tax=Actinoplanes sp. NPDC049265 TaxID=3363902 RepID=UPI003722FC94
MRKRIVVGVLAAVTVLGGAGAAVAVSRRPATPPAKPAPPVTAEVKRETLTSRTTVAGDLGYGESIPILTKAGGTVTWLPSIGTKVARGDVLLRADNTPVVLLYGLLPLYREVRPGVRGPDVALVERNLRDLGYAGFTVDEEYTELTGAAVRRWQRDLGREETGVVDASWVVVTDGAIRVADRRVRLGAPATGEVLAYTGAGSVVTVNVKAGAAGWARPGVKVSVTLPDGKETPGSIASVGAKSEPGESSEEPTVPVTVKLTNPKAVGKVREGPVKVAYVREQRRNVLTVPVAALLARPESGYGLEVAPDGRLVPVDVGMIADGRAEISGGDVAEGMAVGMPS